MSTALVIAREEADRLQDRLRAVGQRAKASAEQVIGAATAVVTASGCAYARHRLGLQKYQVMGIDGSIVVGGVGLGAYLFASGMVARRGLDVAIGAGSEYGGLHAAAAGDTAYHNAQVTAQLPATQGMQADRLRSYNRAS